MQYVSFTLVAFTAFSGLLLNYITVSAKLALATLQQDEYERLRAREGFFKIIAAVVIWLGTTAIIVQMIYYTMKFCRNHGAKVRRIASHAQSAVTRLTSRSSSQASRSQPSSQRNSGDMELSMVTSTAGRHSSASCEPETTAPEIPQGTTLQTNASPRKMADSDRNWQPNPVTGHPAQEGKD